jgi:tetratricopeptide (TPR) repeat protein
MNAVHIDKTIKTELPSTYSACIHLARQLEEKNEINGAIKVYKKCISIKKHDEYAFDRLMILYRKKKEYDKELGIIREGIAAFEKLYKESSQSKPNKVIERISNALLKATGLSDKKGNEIFKPQPILKWHKRAMLLQRKLKNGGMT